METTLKGHIGASSWLSIAFFCFFYARQHCLCKQSKHLPDLLITTHVFLYIKAKYGFFKLIFSFFFK